MHRCAAARSCSPTCIWRPSRELLDALLRSGVSGIAYETVTDASGGLPLLAPMSRIAGKLSIQFGAWALQMANGGSGVLLGGVPGVPPARVLVIGAGAAGASAARVAIGHGRRRYRRRCQHGDPRSTRRAL